VNCDGGTTAERVSMDSGIRAIFSRCNGEEQKIKQKITKTNGDFEKNF
jgi:hypothetical protein